MLDWDSSPLRCAPFPDRGYCGSQEPIRVNTLVAPALPMPLVGAHILGGVISTVSGIGAMFTDKRPGRHVRLGSIYYWSLCWVCASATFLGALRWSEDYYLVSLGSCSFCAASIGLAARRRRWHGWVNTHLVAMGLSYIVMVTAFCVGEGETLPLVNKLPHVSHWILLSLIGMPLIARVLWRKRKVAAF
jgi:hypothetical protein